MARSSANHRCLSPIPSLRRSSALADTEALVRELRGSFDRVVLEPEFKQHISPVDNYQFFSVLLQTTESARSLRWQLNFAPGVVQAVQSKARGLAAHGFGSGWSSSALRGSERQPQAEPWCSRYEITRTARDTNIDNIDISKTVAGTDKHLAGVLFRCRYQVQHNCGGEGGVSGVYPASPQRTQASPAIGLPLFSWFVAKWCAEGFGVKRASASAINRTSRRGLRPPARGVSPSRPAPSGR